jgi:class 3 adenylate cyclase/streptogramin lyase
MKRAGPGWLAIVFAALLGAAVARAEPVRQLKTQSLAVPGASRTDRGDIFEDRDGFIWLGTRGAVVRFDGLRSKTLAVPGARVSQFIQAIAQDSAGAIWLGGDSGLARVVDSASRVEAVPLLTSDGSVPTIRTLVFDRTGTLWGGTDRGLFERRSTGEVRWHRHDPTRPDSLSSDRILALAVAANDHLWVGGLNGLDLWSPREGKATRLGTGDRKNPEPAGVFALAVDAEGAVWAARTFSIDVWRPSQGAWRREQLKAVPGDTAALFYAAVFADGHGQVWIANKATRSVYRYDSRLTVLAKYSVKASPTYTSPLLVDRHGIFWYQTEDGSVAFGPVGTEGLQSVELGTQKSTTREDNTAIYVNDLAAGQGDVLWVGGATVRTLDVATGEIRSFVHDPRNAASMTMDDVHSLRVDPSGAAWVATHRGVDRVDPPSGHVQHFITGDPKLDVGGTVLVTGAELWSANSAGLVRWDVRRRTFQRVELPSPPAAGSDWRLTNIAPGEGTELLLASSTGILAFDRETGRAVFISPERGAMNQVHRDRNGRTWAAGDKGLFMLEAGSPVRKLVLVEAVGPVAVNAIGEDAGGQLWLALPDAVLRFDAGSGRAERYAISQVTSIARIGADLYLGGDNGLQRIRPGLPMYDPHPPGITISELAVDNRERPWMPGSGLNLSADNRSFGIEMAALHYADPARNRYRYKLEGFDADWIEVDASRRYVTYAGLRPGDYRLRVKAASAYGVWSDEKELLNVSVAAPFWQTWWFRIGALLSVALLLAAAYRWRTRVLVRQRAALELTVASRTSELANATRRVTDLLHNILPAPIADAMVRGERSAPARFEDATVLFTDFSGFTQTVATVPPARLVDELNTVFAAFDDIADRCGVEKIKTIGDAYMAVAGVPVPCADHAKRCVRAALLMVRFIEERNVDSSFKWGLRVGIHSGPLVAGIVGKRKYAYDVWGDAVNTASRLESTGAAGRVNISSYTYDLVREEFECEYRGRVEAKGKGALEMYFVMGPRDGAWKEREDTVTLP